LFTDVSDKNKGLLVANQGLYEAELVKTAEGTTEIAVTLLRCVGWLSRGDLPLRPKNAGPSVPTPDAQEIGIRDATYSLIPHSGDWSQGLPLAYTFDLPMKAVATRLRSGELQTSGNLVDITSDKFIISTIKRAEDEKGWIVRGYNPTEEPLSVQLKLALPYKAVTLAQIDETPGQPIKQTKTGSINLQVDHHKVVTLRFR